MGNWKATPVASVLLAGAFLVQLFVHGDLFGDAHFFAAAGLQAETAAVVRAPLAHFTVGAGMFFGGSHSSF